MSRSYIPRPDKISSPTAQVDSTDHYFFVARVHEGVHFRQDALGIKRAALSAHIGDHAERATVIAPVLNLQVRTRALIRRIEHGRRQKFRVREDVGDEN